MKIGRNLRGGETIELSGDLGSGKTAFTTGLAKGMGSDDAVHSPSFTLSNEYAAGELTMYHFDFHRLGEPGIMKQELAEILADPHAVTVVEWGGLVADVLPPARFTIKIQPTGETSRRFTLSYPDKLSYLINT